MYGKAEQSEVSVTSPLSVEQFERLSELLNGVITPVFNDETLSDVIAVL